MNVTVFGMGYVGCVTAACLANCGHTVVGVDLNEIKVDMVNSGCSPIIEPGLSELISDGVKLRRLQATTNCSDLGELVMVCVGTPSSENGSLNLEQMLKALGDIGNLLTTSQKYPVIVIRSTVLPGTVEKIIIPALERRSGKVCGKDFGVCMNPEFMRETTAVRDFAEPPFTIIGSREQRAADCLAKLYANLTAPLEYTTIAEAEMIKYACNAFHAVKVCFANEVGNLSKQLGVDSHRIMEIFCKDDKLNLSPYYLKPGFAFGGSCLPKDLRAILYKAKQVDIDSPMLNALLESNRRQIEIAFNLVRRTGKTSVGVLGLSFKVGTDDLRESPIVTLIELMIGKGYKVKVYDEEVSLAKIHGANRRYIEQTIPHISSLMSDSVEEAINGSDVIVISKKSPHFAEKIQEHMASHTIIDLARLFSGIEAMPRNYEGICW
jgi:GDP-mannose 6-dehydrogenase